MEKSERKKQIVFKNILKVFLKTGKNRLLLTIISGTIIFLLLTSFFMVWFTYRQSFFNNAIATIKEGYSGILNEKFAKVFKDILKEYELFYNRGYSLGIL